MMITWRRVRPYGGDPCGFHEREIGNAHKTLHRLIKDDQMTDIQVIFDKDDEISLLLGLFNVLKS